MSASRLAASLVTGIAAVTLSACNEVETETAVGYEPAKLEDVKGKGDDVKRVVLTREGASRAGVRTGQVGRADGRAYVPYAALLYDEEGEAFVYTQHKPLSFLRAPVDVERIENGRVVLKAGPPAGTKVVTVGTSEVYGVEQEVAGSH
jgi:hypothetical protein